MVYVFVFLGEFGYELLNWQGVIRRFSKTRAPGDSIVCCSRAQVYPLYEMADLYVDISHLALFKHSRAVCYAGTIGVGGPARRLNRLFDAALRASVRAHVRERMRTLGPQWSGRQLRFVFSSTKTTLGDLPLGCDPDRIETDADIGERLDLKANLFRQVEPDLRVREAIERRLGRDLPERYVLVQARTRRVGPQWGTLPSTRGLIDALAGRMPVVLLSFHSGRALDSYSLLEPVAGCLHYTGQSFPEQAALVHFARRCVFFSEGDLGSHVFVPPLMGHDVVSITPGAIHVPWGPTIEFWNRHVFRFGGQIIPIASDEALGSWAAAERTAAEIMTERPRVNTRA